MNTKALLAEFVGTFALIFIGAGAGAVSGNIVAVALAHGLVVMGFAFAFGDISGTHINPAVTIGMLVAGKIDMAKAVQYILAQLLGGIVGALLLNFVVSGIADASGLGATVPADGVSVGQAFILETVLTFLFVTVILHTAVRGSAGNLAPIAIGLTLAFCIMMGGNISGASLNPARTIGPSLFSSAPNAVSSIWIYVVACPLGAALAALLYTGVMND